MGSAPGTISNEIVGTFIDAVYAIAITLLALQLPDQFRTDAPWPAIGGVLLEYCVAFALLFVFWLDQRRINAHVEIYDRGLLALTGLALFLLCLIPTATSLVFRFGDDVTVTDFASTLVSSADLTRAEAVDLFFLITVVATDGAILTISRLGMRHVTDDAGLSIRRAKAMASIILIAVAGLSFLLPVENRYFTLVLPLAVFFEAELVRLFHRFSRFNRKPAAQQPIKTSVSRY